MPHRDYLSAADLSAAELKHLLRLATKLKKRWHQTGKPSKKLRGQTLAAIFEKPSLRTRTTLEVAMTQLGGHTIMLDNSIGLGQREPVRDVACNLDRWVQIIAARTMRHETVEELARWSTVPVINTLSDREHPVQALADLLTMHERWGNFRDRKLAFIGDGNNVAHSLILASALAGLSIAVATPPQYAPDPEIVAHARQLAVDCGSTITITDDKYAAVADADAIYTDVWVSMGQETERDQRRPVFEPYRVDRDCVAATGKPTTIVMHDLPAHRGEEVTEEILDGPQSVIYDQAENRLHVQKALVLMLLGRD